tara:strand:- start:1810 stop:2028 length:219 start_codon:yes stop_codon:yes gene_type:complete
MLDTKTARELLPFVNSPNFDQYIKVYVDAMKESVHKDIMRYSDEVEIFREQGKSAMLDRLLRLSDDVRKSAD